MYRALHVFPIYSESLTLGEYSDYSQVFLFKNIKLSNSCHEVELCQSKQSFLHYIILYIYVRLLLFLFVAGWEEDWTEHASRPTQPTWVWCWIQPRRTYPHRIQPYRIKPSRIQPCVKTFQCKRAGEISRSNGIEVIKGAKGQRSQYQYMMSPSLTNIIFISAQWYVRDIQDQDHVKVIQTQEIMIYQGHSRSRPFMTKVLICKCKFKPNIMICKGHSGARSWYVKVIQGQGYDMSRTFSAKVMICQGHSVARSWYVEVIQWQGNDMSNSFRACISCHTFWRSFKLLKQIMLNIRTWVNVHMGNGWT